MITIRSRLVFTALLAVMCLPVGFAGAGDATPESLVSDMSKALKSLNYEGSFVHVRNGNVESLSIIHSNVNGGELEYMLSLNGEAREVFRDHSSVICIWPGSKSVLVSDSKARKILPTIDESLTSSELYQLSLGEPDRVAGRAVHRVDITPKDHYRYGYRFWIDKETKMLLRSMLLDNESNPIEQVMFTNISYPESIPASRFIAKGSLFESFDKKTSAKPILQEGQDRVDFDNLPIGYAEITETYQPMPINDGPVSHVMLSDGMASVSVYVEYVEQANQKDAALGVSMMGAMNAYTLSLESALVTVVGEVPPAAVEAIAGAVRLTE